MTIYNILLVTHSLRQCSIKFIHLTLLGKRWKHYTNFQTPAKQFGLNVFFVFFDVFNKTQDSMWNDNRVQYNEFAALSTQWSVCCWCNNNVFTVVADVCGLFYISYVTCRRRITLTLKWDCQCRQEYTSLARTRTASVHFSSSKLCGSMQYSRTVRRREQRRKPQKTTSIGTDLRPRLPAELEWKWPQTRCPVGRQ